MVYIPSLTQIQLRILRLTKKYPDKMVRLSYEIPIVGIGDEPIGYPVFLQELVDLDLVQIVSSQVHFDSSRYQQDSWKKFTADLEMPSVLLHESSKGLHEQPLLVILKLQPKQSRVWRSESFD